MEYHAVGMSTVIGLMKMLPCVHKRVTSLKVSLKRENGKHKIGSRFLCQFFSPIYGMCGCTHCLTNLRDNLLLVLWGRGQVLAEFTQQEKSPKQCCQILILIT